ncbi:MAG: PQQ-binding-like beta-propeller repeat protein [Novosphingobium sp.]|nr:PQQ-binding-like beta-propeller repeat protein [Novosphingobium sp.]
MLAFKLPFALLAFSAILFTSAPAGAEDPAPTQFTAAEATVGKALFARNCASCHGIGLDNGSAVALKGDTFAAHWLTADKTLRELARAVHFMPKFAPNSLSEEAYHSLTAYILSANGFELDLSATLDGKLALIPRGEGNADDKPSGPALPLNLPASPPTVAQAKTSSPSDAELARADPSDWLMFNRNYAGDRYSTLAQIDTSNAAKLRPACIMSPGVLGSFQSSPLVYKGMGFVASTYGVFAFDAATCERKWDYTYAPAGPEGIQTSRGVAAYDGKLFRGTPDGHLIALDMTDGALLWDVHVADGSAGYSVGAAPIVFDGRVIVGLAGGDYGVPGHVYAFDADTGERIWTFDTIDAESWTIGAEHGGGGTWTTVAVDTEERLVFVPVGNPAPDYYLAARPGDNLYTNSIVALDIDTGKLAWHVQQLAGDYHDWDTSAAPALYEKDGRRLMAVGTKEGFVYIYDRDTQEQVARTPIVPRLNDTLPFTDKPLRVCPGTTSGVEWNGPAFDPSSGSLFVNTVDWCATYTATKPQGYKRGSWYVEADVAYDPPEKMKGWTYALDGATGEVRWSRKAPKPMIGAVTPTAGGIILTGGADGMFLALDASDGSVLYRFNTGAAIGGGISTYMVDGRQYVAVATGGFGLVDFGVRGAPAVVVFALPEDGD